MTLLLLVRSPAAGGGGGGDTISINFPAADQRLLVGETVAIEISATPGVSGSFDVLLSLDDGDTFLITLHSDAAAIDLDWLITADHISATAVLRVLDAANNLIFGDSDPFVIATTSTAGGGGSGLTAEQQAQLDRIEAATGQITGARLQVVGPVTAAGVITIYHESNYTVALGTELTRTVSDAGLALYNDLTAFSLSELRFRASPEPTPGQTTHGSITGTIAEVTESAGITYIVIEISEDDIPDGPYHDGWKYHIFAIDGTDGETPPFVEGDLTLKWKA